MLRDSYDLVEMANKKPGPFHSALNGHLAEIAALRNTEPFPTPYSKISEILQEKYGLKISANAIWSFVRTRTPGRGRKLKYKLPKELAKPQSAAPTPAHPPGTNVPAGPAQPTDEPSDPADASEVPKKPATSVKEQYAKNQAEFLKKK